MVGTVPIHLLHEDAGEKVPSFDELLIDVGAADKQTAEALAPVGSFAYFSESYIAFGDGKICAKALDDRIGCMLMIELFTIGAGGRHLVLLPSAGRSGPAGRCLYRQSGSAGSCFGAGSHNRSGLGRRDRR